jgi:1,4-alpha-glucan branching enzyme
MATVKNTKKRKAPNSMQVAETQKEVEFTFFNPEVKSVFLAGSFNDWNTESLPMVKGKDGTWKTRVKLQQGTYEYKYFVDGIWAQDMPCDDLNLNPYGTCNCVLGVQ